MSIQFHEEMYRGRAAMAKLRDFPVTVCGAGALGANLCETLARQGFARLRVIDRDRIEERNLSTQPFYRSEIGGLKAKMLANALYRALGVTVEARAEELRADNVGRLLAGSGLVLDAFDNSVARGTLTQHCGAHNVACLHAGLAADYAEVLWNEIYRVPSATQDDVCDYPLARNLVQLAVSVAAEAAVRFVLSGIRESYTITLGDLAIRPV